MIANLLKSSIVSMVLNSCHALISITLTIVIANKLDTEGFGNYTFWTSVALTLALLAQLGHPTLIVREIAKCTAGDGSQGKLVFFLKWVFRNILISLLLVGLGFFVLGVITGTSRSFYFVVYLLAVSLVFISIAGAMIKGLERPNLAIFLEKVVPYGFFLFVVHFFLESSVDGFSFIFTQFFAIVLGVVFSAFFLFGSLSNKLYDYKSDNTQLHDRFSGDRDHWRKAIYSMSLIVSAQALNKYVDTIFVGLMLGSESTASYGVAVKLSALMQFGLISLNMIVAPKYAKLYKIGDMASFQRLISYSSAIMTFVAIVSFLFLMIFGDYLIDVFFGSAYSDSFYILVVLSVGLLVSATCGSVGFILTMTGNERVVQNVTLLSVLFNISLNPVFIYFFGVYGAAIVTAASISFVNILLLFLVHKRVGVFGSLLGLVRKH